MNHVYGNGLEPENKEEFETCPECFGEGAMVFEIEEGVFINETCKYCNGDKQVPREDGYTSEDDYDDSEYYDNIEDYYNDLMDEDYYKKSDE